VNAATPTASPRERREIGAAREPRRGFGTKYTRFVGMMKLILPLSAAALVGLVLAWPNDDDSGSTIPLSFSSIQLDGNGAPGMTRARFIGADKNAQPFVITADTVTQDTSASDRFNLVALQADMTFDSGPWITLMAPRGVFDRAENWLRLPDTVDIYSDQGFELHTRNAVIDLNNGIARGDSPVDANSPLGNLRAGGFEFIKEGERLIFRTRVRVTLLPYSNQ
jgi:lipopolysaccharide export system protein LptC